MTVAELLSRVSSRELTQWMIFYQTEPFGSEADLYGFAIVASTIANVHRGKGKKAYSPDDFMPKFKTPEKQDINKTVNFVTMMNKALGGEDKRK